MKSKKILFVGLFVVLAASTYWLLELKRPKVKIEHILPETSLFVLHGSNLKASLSSVEKFDWVEALKEVPFVETLYNWSAKVDSLQQSGQLRSAVTSLPFWISFHSTASDEVAPLYVLQADGFQWNEESIITILQEITGKTFTTSLQVFNDYELINVVHESSRLVMLIQGDYLVISEENILVEDVVRALQNESSRLVVGAMEAYPESDIQLVLNTKRLSELERVFFKEVKQPQVRKPEIAFVGLKFTTEGIEARGAAYLQSLLEAGESSIFGKNLVPLSAIDFSWRPFKIGMEEFEPLLKGELLSVTLDMNFSDVSKVLLINTTDTVYLRRTLERISEQYTSPQDSAVYSEYYLSTYLGFVQQDDFVKELTGLEEPMGAPYYAIFQNALILSDNLDALKTVMNEFDNESTWGKSVQKREILDDIVQETNLTVFKDFAFASESMIDRLKPKWHEFIEEKPALKQLFKRFQLQLNASNANYLVSSFVAFNEIKPQLLPGNKVPAGQEQRELNIRANVFADTTLITKPFVVRNHVNASLEVIFQDHNNTLYLASRQGDVLWKLPVEAPVIGPIHQIDYFNNKKLQYLFFTDSLVHLIDRNGEVVEGFPKPYEAPMAIEGSAVVDYDNSKRYRYLTRDRRGNISLFDKEVNLLEGWNPNAMEGNLLQTPFHVRVRGRDAFVAVEVTGEISLLNRRGEYYQGFPQKFDQRFSGDVAFIKGPNFAGTQIAVIGQEGELLKLNLEGKLVQSKQFFRPTTRSIYSMVSDVLETGYRVFRNDQNRIAFFDMEGQEVFEIPLENSGNLEVEFYNFRNGRELYVIRDKTKQTLHLLNGEGVAIAPIIPAAHRVSILYYQNLSEYEVFVNFANQMNIYTIDAK